MLPTVGRFVVARAAYVALLRPFAVRRKDGTKEVRCHGRFVGRVQTVRTLSASQIGPSETMRLHYQSNGPLHSVELFLEVTVSKKFHTMHVAHLTDNPITSEVRFDWRLPWITSL